MTERRLSLAMDTRPLEESPAGIARYVREYAVRLLRLPSFRLFMLSGDPFRCIRPLRTEADLSKRVFQVPFPFKKAVRRLLTEPRIYQCLRGMDVQILWGTNYQLPRPVRGSWKQVITVHDLAWRRFPGSVKRPLVRMLDRLGNHVAVADRVFTVSAFTKKELVDWLGVSQEKVVVVGNGVDARFRPVEITSTAVQDQYRLSLPFMLSVGTIEPRKNLERLIRAFDLVAPKIKHSLVIVGARGWKTSPIYGAYKASPFRDRIVFTGFVNDAELPAVYNLADAVVYPSLYEGFGIPVIEAMACGTPVITSNLSALPEVAGDAALLVDPFDVRALADAMERIVQDEPLRATLRAKGLERAKQFSWDASVAEVARCFRELCA